MPEYLRLFERFLNSPPGQFTAAVVLATVVWKFFERVEAILTDQTKFEIAVWLVSVSATDKVRSWPRLFAAMFDRVFGTEHFSWRCFIRACLASSATAGLAWLLAYSGKFVSDTVLSELTGMGYNHDGQLRIFTVDGFSDFLGTMFMMNALPDYVSLLKTRYLLQSLTVSRSLPRLMSVLVLDAALSLTIVTVPMAIASERLIQYNWRTVISTADRSNDEWFEYNMERIRACCRHKPGMGLAAAEYLESRRRKDVFRMWGAWIRLARLDGGNELIYIIVLPSLFASLWLWLYAGSGFLLRAAQRFDILFRWFNTKCDIERKPLQAIGLVSGTVLALIYWGAVLAARLVGSS